MAYKIVYAHLANLDVAQAVEYYLINASKRITRLFYEEITSAEKILTNSPYFEIIFKDFRRFPLKKFPYILIYKINESDKIITIFRVFHTSQNPEKYPN